SDPLELCNFGENLLKQETFFQESYSPGSITFYENFDELLTNPFLADLPDLIGQLENSFAGIWFQAVIEACCKPDRPHEAKLVLEKALFRITYGPDRFPLDILLSSHKIQNSFCQRVVEQSVNGKVSSQDIARWVIGV